MNSCRALIMTFVFSIGYLPSQSIAESDDPAPSDRINIPRKANFFVDGIVKDRKKYSFTLVGPERQYEVRLSSLTSVHARLLRPKIDWKKLEASVAIPMSSPDGAPKNNEIVKFKLPTKLMISSRFESDSQRIEVTRSEPFELRNLIVNQNNVAPSLGNNDRNELRGELFLTNEPGIFRVDFGEVQKRVRLDLSVLRLDGFSIADLIPYATDVFVDGVKTGNVIEATNIDFISVGDQLKRESKKLPRVLLIGDKISFNYFRALKKDLSGMANVHHPNSNCRGSANESKLHRWLGAYDLPNRQWDVIAFNFGHADANSTKETYQANIEKAISKLRNTNAKLIWINSTPIPFGFNDKSLRLGNTIPIDQRSEFEFEEASANSMLPGRMRDLNLWAKQVIQRHPKITTCDLWNVVKQNVDGTFDQWWFGKDENFKFKQSKPLANELADSIRKQLK